MDSFYCYFDSLHRVLMLKAHHHCLQKLYMKLNFILLIFEFQIFKNQRNNKKFGIQESCKNSAPNLPEQICKQFTRIFGLTLELQIYKVLSELPNIISLAKKWWPPLLIGLVTSASKFEKNTQPEAKFITLKVH